MGRKKKPTFKEREEQLEEIVSDMEEMGAISHQWTVQKMNLKTGRWHNKGDLPCYNGPDKNLRLMEVLKEKWGPGEYLLDLYTVDGAKVPHLGSKKVIVDDDEKEKKESDGDDMKKKKVDVNEMLAEDIETMRLLRVKQQIEKSIKNDDDSELDKEELLATIEEMLEKQKEDQEAKKDKSGENVSTILLQHQLKMYENQQNSSKGDNGNTTLVELFRIQSENQRAFYESLRPQQNNFEAAIDKLMASPLVAKVVDRIFEPRTNAFDSLVPSIIEKSTTSFTNFSEKITEIILQTAMKEPATDPQDLLNQRLRFLDGIKKLVMPSLKELIQSFAEIKMQTAVKSGAATTTPATTPGKSQAELEKEKQQRQEQLNRDIQQALYILKINASNSAENVLQLLKQSLPTIVEFFRDVPSDKILAGAQMALDEQALTLCAQVLELVKTGKVTTPSAPPPPPPPSPPLPDQTPQPETTSIDSIEETVVPVETTEEEL